MSRRNKDREPSLGSCLSCVPAGISGAGERCGVRRREAPAGAHFQHQALLLLSSGPSINGASSGNQLVRHFPQGRALAPLWSPAQGPGVLSACENTQVTDPACLSGTVGDGCCVASGFWDWWFILVITRGTPLLYKVN